MLLARVQPCFKNWECLLFFLFLQTSNYSGKRHRGERNGDRVYHSRHWVSWVFGHPKNSSWGVRLKGNFRPTSQQRDVGISHFEAAVKCTKICVKLHKIAHEMPPNRLRLGLCARPRWGCLQCNPEPLVCWGWAPLPHSSPLDIFDCCSWTFVGTGKMDIPNF